MEIVSPPDRASEMETFHDHKYWKQVNLDVDRSFRRFPAGIRWFYHSWLVAIIFFLVCMYVHRTTYTYTAVLICCCLFWSCIFGKFYLKYGWVLSPPLKEKLMSFFGQTGHLPHLRCLPHSFLPPFQKNKRSMQSKAWVASHVKRSSYSVIKASPSVAIRSKA